MATEIKMPQLGLTMTEGTVTQWFKKVGDAISQGELLFEVSTEKITNQIESTATGFLLEIRTPEGVAAPVQAVVGLIGAAGEIVAAQAELTTKTTAAKPETIAAAVTAAAGGSAVVAGGGWVKASPAARKLAGDLSIDLALVTASGPEGRVVERDVEAFAQSRPAAVKASPLAAKIATELGVDISGLAKDGRVMKEDVLAAAAPAVIKAPPKKAMITGIRKVISERMSRSWQTAPHVHLTVEVDMTAALALKEKLAEASGQKASVTEIVIKCAAQALTEFPAVNASIDGNQIVYHEIVNMGVAVSIDNGLIVPVVTDAAKKSLREIRAAVVELGTKARAGKLLPDEISGGTFTVTNLGMYGTDHVTRCRLKFI